VSETRKKKTTISNKKEKVSENSNKQEKDHYIHEGFKKI
jgi:hypothetical protein